MENPDTATATASGSIFCSQIYAQTQTTNEQCSLAIAFNGELLRETISGILEIQANVADTLATTGTITLSLESGTVSGMFAWKATQVTPGKFDADPAAGHTGAADQLHVLPGGNEGNGEFGAQHEG
jgi:hypothetical protein